MTAEKLKPQITDVSVAKTAKYPVPTLFNAEPKFSDLDVGIHPGQFTIQNAAEFVPKMTFFHDSMNRAEIYFDPKTDELVMENKVTGKVLRV